MNREEFVSRVERDREMLLRIARSMVQSRDCEDAVQSAILSAWEHLSELRDENAFEAWLRQILINRCRQIQRAYKRNREAYAALRDCDQVINTSESSVYEAMEGLSDEERRLIRLHHEQGYTIKEIAAATGKSEDVLKMRLYRARKHLKAILISFLLLILLASVAIGTGMIDVNWFLKNRRAEPAATGNAVEPGIAEIDYSGNMLDVSISDAVWDEDALSLTFVYSITGQEEDALVVHRGNIGVDGVRLDHIWTDEGIMPLREWADGRVVQVFSVDGWRLNGIDIRDTQDYLPDGKGETFMAEMKLDMIRPDMYEDMLDESGMLEFSAALVVEEYPGGDILESGMAAIRVSAPTAEEWREMYEASHR
ncbi:MAG: sigma-70 family RNA polymerase sigma factor [Clostridia bacterium]|nr:sigma-70 family RNA polymerase sigma factor [Clostridia bacterium]